MIEKIIPDRISLTLPTVFGEELTFLEFCGKLRAKLNECIDVVNENTSDIQQNASAIQQNTTDIQKNANDINTLQEKTAENIIDIKKNTAAISKNTTDIQKNTSAIQQNASAIAANTSAIQQNTSNISKNELSIATTDAAFKELRADFLKQKAESLFAPVILNVDPHSLGADINASVYVRIGRISYNLLGCIYAKVNISFSGATDAKTLKILSVQFGKRSILSLDDPAQIFTAKTGVINLPISVVGTVDMPAGSSDMAVTGVNFFGAMDGITDTVSAFTLNDIPTGKDILCDSLAFTSPGGSEQDPKVLYTLRVVEGHMDILTIAAGISASTGRAYLYIDFADVISNSNIYTQFLCQGGSYNGDTISTVPDAGAVLGSALINYLEDGTNGGEVYEARTILTIENGGGTPSLLKKPGNISKNLPAGQAAHISLTFDLFR